MSVYGASNKPSFTQLATTVTSVGRETKKMILRVHVKKKLTIPVQHRRPHEDVITQAVTPRQSTEIICPECSARVCPTTVQHDDDTFTAVERS